MTQDFNSTQGYITTLTGRYDTVCDFRAIHDQRKDIPAHTFRGTLTEIWSTLVDYNSRGYGIFVCINSMDGQGREYSNVQFIRAHVADLDNVLTSVDGLQRASAAHPQPHFAVQSSPQKFHVYWLVQPYTNNDYYTIQQRKLAQLYDGDRTIIDPTRVLRLPGFYHQKSEPYLTMWWPIHHGASWPVTTLADSIAHVNVLNHIGIRSPLGDVEMQAPSLDWLKFAINMLDPNELDRGDWLPVSAAFKQAGWNLTDEHSLKAIWGEWCARYVKGKGNDVGENNKLWHSVRDTEVGWAAFERRTDVGAYLNFGYLTPPQGVVAQTVERVVGGNNEVVGAIPTHPTEYISTELPDPTSFNELLDPEACSQWFKHCYFIARQGEIFSPSGRFMNSTTFNAMYGGKHFILGFNGKTTDEPWKAALRSTSWTVPKIDHMRFLPDEKPFALVKDELGRTGLNTYIPVCIEEVAGDISPWLDHMKLIMPNDNDRRIFIEYMAHCVKFPGVKIAWAPMFQSTEGVGKGMIYEIMKRSLGAMYTYTPKAQELVTSGSKFNAWMRAKLCIVVNEIKIDEKRELIEILKPMITDPQIEVQAKGADQEMEDNLANWIFFSNFKDAIPISQNGRRYAIFFSSMQTMQDKIDAGIDKTKPYFTNLFRWLEKENGYKMITYYLRNYPIEQGAVGIEAPETSSYREALRISRSPMQVLVEDAITDGLQGFMGGYISNVAIKKRMSATGIKPPSEQSIRALLEGMGYSELGRSQQPYLMEDAVSKATIYGKGEGLTLGAYGAVQGYNY